MTQIPEGHVGVGYIQVGDDEPMRATLASAGGKWTITNLEKLWDIRTKVKELNPFVPSIIYVNEKSKTVIVEWKDGEKIRVTCDKDDTFDVHQAFTQALTYKVFGNYNKSKHGSKRNFKEFWLPKIERTIVDVTPKPKKAKKSKDTK